jgi:hypothetical protein
MALSEREPAPRASTAITVKRFKPKAPGQGRGHGLHGVCATDILWPLGLAVNDSCYQLTNAAFFWVLFPASVYATVRRC